VTGWAWNPNEPQERVTVSIWVNGRQVASGLADQHAGGLKKAGIGDGHHAFAIQLPDEVTAESDPRVAVRVDGALGSLPLLESWADTGDEEPWASVRLTEDTRPLPATPIEDDVPPAESEPATAALRGGEGWLFGLSESETRRLRGLQRVVADLQDAATLLEALGIRYVVAIAPAKLSVHPERAAVATAGLERCARDLEALARDSDSLDLLDLLPVLQDARRHGPLFLPREETLSALGAFHVQRALIKRAGPPLRALALDALALAPALDPGADPLGKLPAIGESPAAADGVPDAADAAALRALRMPAGRHLEIEGLPAPRVYERTDAPDLPRAVLVGDPVIHAVAPWLAEATSRLVVMSSPQVPLGAVELEHPAAVLHVLEDRRLLAAM
jgi:hypothetical protein